MKILPALLITWMVACHVAGTARAEIYKWVDEKGVLHFGDIPPQQAVPSLKVESVPIESRPTPDLNQTQPVVQPNKPLVPLPSPSAEPAPEYEEAEVELYTTSWCGYCRQAREFFHLRGIRFTEYDIEVDEEAARRKQEIDPRPGIPLAVINGQVILGFSKTAYEQALASRSE